MLSSTTISGLNSFKKITKKVSQLQYYVTNESSPEIISLVSLGNKPFGDAIEDILRETFGFGIRTSSQNDATWGPRKIEIKSARYWGGKDYCRWQHLEPDHDYDLVFFVIVDFHCLKVWAIEKEKLMGEMREKKIVTYQGKQGWWTEKHKILPYLTEIKSVADLEPFDKQTSPPPTA